MRGKVRYPLLALLAGAAIGVGGCAASPATQSAGATMPETATAAGAPSANTATGTPTAADAAAGTATGSTPAGIPTPTPMGVPNTAAAGPDEPTTAGAPDPTPASTPAEGGGIVASQDSASSADAEPTVMPTTASVTLYFIALGDGGASGPAVGCGDSAVPVTSAAVSYTDPVEAALRTLLAGHSRQVGESGLENTLWQSHLQVASVDRGGTPVVIHLTGSLVLGGECDIQRVQQQLLLTAADAAGAPVAITVNGKTLSEALSLK